MRFSARELLHWDTHIWLLPFSLWDSQGILTVQVVEDACVAVLLMRFQYQILKMFQAWQHIVAVLLMRFEKCKIPEKALEFLKLPFSLWDSSNLNRPNLNSFLNVAVLLMRFLECVYARPHNYVAVLLMRFAYPSLFNLFSCSCCRSPYEIQQIKELKQIDAVKI